MAEHATIARIGYLSQFQRGNGDGPPETFTNVSEVVSFEPPDAQADDIEVTHFESPGGYKEYIRGMLDAGEASFSINWDPTGRATHAQIRTDKNSGLAHNYRFVLPGSIETITFPAYVKGLKRNVEPNGAITADVTLKVTGAPTEV
jgi:predicted secreted protein